MYKTADLQIRIWIPKGSRKTLPNDLPEAFAPHVEHVQSLVEQGYVSGQIVDDAFDGWWEIKAA
jgi:hypothetical protein